ncbi:Mitochondrial protein Pet127 [Phaffia rhodozyma]|uniref:Mitochondrial protein Pet127 n=1 Tax=Phaffia rhodozyma TaxID=264483 RepID=A0A0F7SNC6_PHARH|nr:Mitochondrial protein Pet127 [Phaffia rhodozyma]
MSLISRFNIRSNAALSLSRRSTSRVSLLSLPSTLKSTDQSIAFGRVYSSHPKQPSGHKDVPHLSSPESRVSTESHFVGRRRRGPFVRSEGSQSPSSSSSPQTSSSSPTTTTTTTSSSSSSSTPSSSFTPSSPSASVSRLSSKPSSHKFAIKPPEPTTRPKSYQGLAADLYNQYVTGKLAPLNRAKPVKREILPSPDLKDEETGQADARKKKDGGGSGRVRSWFVRDINASEINGESSTSVSNQNKDRVGTEVKTKPQQTFTSENISLARGFERTLEGDQNIKDGKMQFYKEPVEKGGVLLFESDARKIPQPEILDVKKIISYPTTSQLAAMESAADKDSRPTFLSDSSYFSTLCALVYNSISARSDLSDKGASSFQNYRPMSFNLLQKDDTNVYHIVEDVDLSVQPLKHFKNIDTIVSKMMTTPTDQMENLIGNVDFVDQVEQTRLERAKVIELMDIYLGASRLYSSPNLPGNGEFSVKTKVTNRIMHDCMPGEGERLKKFDEQMELFQIERESSNLRDMVQDWFMLRLEERQGLLTVFHNTSQLQGFEYRSIDFFQDALFSLSLSSPSSSQDSLATNEAMAESRFRETIIAVTEILQRISVDFNYHSDLNVIINQREQNPLAIYVFSHGLSKESSASGKRAGKMLLGSYIYEYRNAPGSEAWSPETTVITRDIFGARDEIAMEMQDIGEALNRPANPLFLLSIYDPTDLLNLFDRRRDLAPGWRNPSLADGSSTSHRSSDGGGRGREIDAYTFIRDGTDIARQPPPSFLSGQTNTTSPLPSLSFDLGIHAPKAQYRPWKEVLTSPPTASADAPVLANGLYTTDYSALFKIARRSGAWTSKMEPMDRNLVGEPNRQRDQMVRWNKIQSKMKSIIEKEFPAPALSTSSAPSAASVPPAPWTNKSTKWREERNPHAPRPVLTYKSVQEQKTANRHHVRDSIGRSKPIVATPPSNPPTPNAPAPNFQIPTYQPKVDSEKAVAAWHSAEHARRRVVDFFAKEEAINPDANYEVDLKTGHGLLNKPVRHEVLANFIKINPNAPSSTQDSSSSSVFSPPPSIPNSKSSPAATAAISAAVAVARKSSGNILYNSPRLQPRNLKDYKRPKK